MSKIVSVHEEAEDHGFTCEARTSVFQKSVASLVMMLLGTCMVVMALCIIWPHRFLSADRFDHESLETRATLFVLALSIFTSLFYAWWVTMNLHLAADKHGITQFTGFRKQFVAWKDISSYRIQSIGEMRDQSEEPVLLDKDGRILLYPVKSFIRGDPTAIEQRALFWQYVIEQIDARE